MPLTLDIIVSVHRNVTLPTQETKRDNKEAQIRESLYQKMQPKKNVRHYIM